MDAYNRGYNAGISGLSEASDGSIGISGIKVVANLESFDLDEEAEAAGFYAIAYNATDGSQIDGFNTGDVVISYRGTDNPDPFTIADGASDLWNGWISGVC